ncbi:MAG: hypothetical protein ACT4PP_09810 [Sporichthyaceae bacterium]
MTVVLKKAAESAPAHGNSLLANLERSGRNEGGERAALADSAIRLSTALRRDVVLRMWVRLGTRKVAAAHRRLDRRQAYEHRVQAQLAAPEALVVHQRTRTERAGRWTRGHIGAWVSSAGAWFVFLVGAVGDGSLAVAAARRDLDVPASVSVWDVTDLDSLFALTLGGVVVLTLYFLMAFGAHTLAWWVYPPSDLHANAVDGIGPRMEFRRHVPARVYAALTLVGTAGMCWAFHKFSATRFAPAGPFAERSVAAEAFIAFSSALPALMLALAIVAANPQFVFTRKLARAHMLSGARRRWTVHAGDVRAAKYRNSYLAARRGLARVQDRIDAKGLTSVHEYVGAALALPQLSSTGFAPQRAVDVGGLTQLAPARVTGEPTYVGDFVPQLPAAAGQFVAALLVEFAALPVPVESAVAQYWTDLDRAADAVKEDPKGRGGTAGVELSTVNGAARANGTAARARGAKGGAFVSTSGLVKEALKGSVPLLNEKESGAAHGAPHGLLAASSNRSVNGSSSRAVKRTSSAPQNGLAAAKTGPVKPGVKAPGVKAPGVEAPGKAPAAKAPGKAPAVKAPVTKTAPVKAPVAKTAPVKAEPVDTASDVTPPKAEPVETGSELTPPKAGVVITAAATRTATPPVSPVSTAPVKKKAPTKAAAKAGRRRGRR